MIDIPHDARATAANITDPAGSGRPASYQIILVTLLSLNFGIVCFDRNALNYLVPFLKPELGLSNAQVGMLVGSLSLTWSVAAFGMGRLSDVIGRRKTLLVLSTLAFATCSFISGLAGSFVILLGARLMMGVAEGGVMPLSHAILAVDVSPKRRGLAQGIAQNVGSNLFGAVIAPVVLVGVAQAYGWRSSFFIAGAPGVLSAILMWMFLKEPVHAGPKVVRQADLDLRLIDVLRERNILICVAMGILLISYLTIGLTFMALYLHEIRSLPTTTVGWLLGIFGLSATLGSFIATSLSDRIGRRPVLMMMPYMGVVMPLSAMWTGSSDLQLGLLFFFFGWGVNGIFSLFMATVPSESVDPRYAATVLGLCMGVSEMFGGALSPLLAGLAADALGLATPLWIMVGLAVSAGLVAVGLRETAPARVG